MSPRNRQSDASGGLLPDEGPETVVAVTPGPAEPVAAEPAETLEPEPEAAAPESAPEPEAAEPESSPPGEERLPSLRVASLHLRMGQHALARAELEAFAGRGLLDEQALLDLAEVRWRSGDLVGATEAASALISRGHETLLALVIAAEGFAVSARPTEARRLALRAVEMAGIGLESVFAGMPSSRIWPAGLLPASPGTATPDESDELAELAGLAAPLVQGPEPEPDAQPEPKPEPDAQPEPQPEPETELAAEPDPQPDAQPEPQPVDALGADAGEQAALESEAKAAAAVQPATPSDNAIAAAAVAMHSGRIDQASLLFGLALRLNPASAAFVLEQLGVPAADPRLALVEGDALQLLGRDVEALDAFRRAAGSLFDGGSKD
jgi:outer membrane biosynthesis protein TonB